MLSAFLKRYTFRQKACLFLEEYIGFFVRYLPGYEGILMRRVLCRLTFKVFPRGALIWPNVYITHGFNISAGKLLAVNFGSHIDGRGGIHIGDHVLIGPNVFIGSSNHVISPDINTPRITLGHVMKPVTIGNNVWIGANSVICPGVRIGDNSVIAAGSIVIKDIPESVLAAGNPAGVLRAIS